MAITDLGTLQAATESWLERSFDDALFLEFAANVTDTLNRGLMGADGRWIVPPLRCRAMLTTDTLTTSGAQVALPADWLEFERVWIDANDGKDLLYFPLTQFRTQAVAQQTGTPTIYTIDGQTIFTAPTSDADIEVSYFAALDALTGDSSVNAVLTAHPRVYLAGTIAEALSWVGGNEAREDREMARFSAAVRGLNAEHRQAQAGGSVLVMRAQSVA